MDQLVTHTHYYMKPSELIITPKYVDTRLLPEFDFKPRNCSTWTKLEYYQRCMLSRSSKRHDAYTQKWMKNNPNNRSIQTWLHFISNRPKMRWQSCRKLPDQQFVPPVLHMFTTGWIHRIPMCELAVFQYSDGCMSKYSAHRLSRSTLYWPNRWIISSEQQYMQAILPMSGRTIHILHLSRRHIFSYGYKLLHPGSPTQLSR
jgi:hypothetical protein